MLAEAVERAPAQASDPARQEKAKEYARIHRRLLVVDLLIFAGYLLVWILSGLAAALKTALLSVTTNQWMLVILFGGVLGLGYLLLTLPLSFYSGLTLPHRYGLSTQTVRGWMSDLFKGMAVGGVLGGLVLEGLYALLRASPDWWWLYGGLGYLLLVVVIFNLTPVLIAPLFYKFVPLGEEHADLAGRLTRLAQNAGASVRGVFKIDLSKRTRAANAALMGIGNTRRIVLGDTLLNEFQPDEIETVLAHELGHHVHKDIPFLIAIDSAVTLVGLYLLSLGLRWSVTALGYASIADIAGLPLFALGMGAFGLLTLPLTNGFSRSREALADAYAVQATNKPEAFASALTRLANQNLADADPDPWVEWLLHSHPSLGRRKVVLQTIEAARRAKGNAS